MRLLPDSRPHRALFLLFTIALAVSCIDPPYARYLVLQHIPTAAAVLALIVAERKLGISLTSYALIIAFLALHVLGARYLYSYVPYDVWSEKLLGASISATLGATRNHYDRAVHLLYGLLIAVPAYRFSRRFLKLNGLWAGSISVQFILATGALYEVAEWFVAVSFAPEWAREYNGQQGDWWDAQKDMALAFLGAAFSATILAASDCAQEKLATPSQDSRLEPKRPQQSRPAVVESRQATAQDKSLQPTPRDR